MILMIKVIKVNYKSVKPWIYRPHANDRVDDPRY